MKTTATKAHRWFWLFAIVAVALAQAGCHQGDPFARDGDGGGALPPGGGEAAPVNFVLFAEDQPSGNVLSFEATVSSVTLTSTTGSVVTVLPSAEAVELEWRSRTVGPTLIRLADVAAATYNNMTVTIVSPEMLVFDPVMSTFSRVLPPACSGASFTVDVPVNLSVTSSALTGVRLHLNLRDSIELIPSTNNLCLRPMFEARPTSFVSGQLPGDIDDVLGTVDSVSTSSGQFGFTVFSSGESRTFVTDANTLFEGVSGLSGLAVGNRVEVDARLQSSGNFLAQEVERETSSNTVQQLRGMVLARTPALGMGDLTSFNLLVMDAIGTPPAAQEPGEIVTVTVDGSTAFRVSTEDQIPFPTHDGFDRTFLQIGQFVHVVQRSGAAGFTADSITLEEIALTGQVGPTVGLNSFDLVPDGDFFTLNGLGTINAITTTVTEFEDFTALGNLQPNQSIVGVRGVLVFQGGNGVLVTKRVRLLQP